MQFMVQMGGIEQKMESWPLPVRSSTLGAIERTALERMSYDQAHASSVVYLVLP